MAAPADRKLYLDLAAWAGNVSTSCMIIFVNKILMSTTGYGFKYGTHLYRFSRHSIESPALKRSFFEQLLLQSVILSQSHSKQYISSE
jgi:hypothetical protein